MKKYWDGGKQKNPSNLVWSDIGHIMKHIKEQYVCRVYHCVIKIHTDEKNYETYL